jgi:hypothetical protein
MLLSPIRETWSTDTVGFRRFANNNSARLLRTGSQNTGHVVAGNASVEMPFADDRPPSALRKRRCSDLSGSSGIAGNLPPIQHLPDRAKDVVLQMTHGFPGCSQLPNCRKRTAVGFCRWGVRSRETASRSVNWLQDIRAQFTHSELTSARTPAFLAQIGRTPSATRAPSFEPARLADQAPPPLSTQTKNQAHLGNLSKGNGSETTPIHETRNTDSFRYFAKSVAFPQIVE